MKRVVVSDGGFFVVITLKGSQKFYADNPEVVESGIQRLKEIIRHKDAVKSAK